ATSSVTPAISPGVTRHVSPGVAPPSSTGVAQDAQHNVAASTTSGPTAEGSFTEGAFEVAYDELTPTPLLNLTERAPRANTPLLNLTERAPRANPRIGQNHRISVGVSPTPIDSFGVSEEENMVTEHQDPLH
ncbi:unnamed protein product, partial [Laminaria digitata]